MLDAILRWRSKWRRLAAHLEKNGVRAPATVVEIASWGSDNTSSRGEIDLEDELENRMPGNTLAPANTSEWYVRKTKLKIRPEGEPEFEMEGKIRYGDWGLDVPKAGDEIDVIYDPNDHSKVMRAPLTDMEEAQRISNALGDAKIGIQVGGGGAKVGGAKPPSEEQLAASQNQMDQAQSMLEQAQQFMPGLGKPGEDSEKKKESGGDD
jgi:hypothetical protein